MDPWQQKALAYGYHLPQHTAINLPDIHVHIAGKITRLKLHSLKKEIISKWKEKYNRSAISLMNSSIYFYLKEKDEIILVIFGLCTSSKEKIAPIKLILILTQQMNNKINASTSMYS